MFCFENSVFKTVDIKKEIAIGTMNYITIHSFIYVTMTSIIGNNFNNSPDINRPTSKPKLHEWVVFK